MTFTCSSIEFSPFNLPERVIFRLVNRQKVVQISCGWRHTLAVTDHQNVYSWGRGTNGQLGNGQSCDR